MKERRILHVDMDAFFAAIEQRDQPRLRGKPVIVGGVDCRGVASTCSYEARKFGVHSAMPIREAKRLCPHGIFMSPNLKKYVYASVKVLEILHKYSPCVEPTSIDEAYLDITDTARLFGGAEELGRSLKQEVYRTLKLTCSVGIAPTKNFAKIASNMKKPDGLTVISGDGVESCIHVLPVGAISGVGSKTVEILHRLSIETVGDLARFDRKLLTRCLGIYGEALSRTARGESGADVVSLDEAEDEKSIGHEHTLSEDTADPVRIRCLLLWLATKTARRLRERKMMGKTAVLKLRYADFTTHTHRHTYQDFFRDDDRLFTAAEELFAKAYRKGRTVRLLGVSVSGLVRQCGEEYGQGIQIGLFESDSAERKERLHSTVDALKNMHGENIIRKASTIRMWE